MPGPVPAAVVDAVAADAVKPHAVAPDDPPGRPELRPLPADVNHTEFERPLPVTQRSAVERVGWELRQELRRQLLKLFRETPVLPPELLEGDAGTGKAAERPV